MRQLFLLQLNDGNRKETEQKSAIPEQSLISLSHTHTHTDTHTESGFQDKTHRMPQAVVTDADTLPDTYKCGHPVVRSWYFFIILVTFSADATSSSLLVHPPVNALDFFTTTVTLSAYLEMLLNSRPSCLSPTGLQCHIPGRQTHVRGHKVPSIQKERDRDHQKGLSVQLCW